MPFKIKDPEKIARIATIATLTFLVCWNLCTVIAEVKPFWVDEWRVIYNLKFKNAKMLWGTLDFLQQFPRVYLQLIKLFTSWFGYNYFSLRFPSWVVGTATILFCYRLMDKIYTRKNANRFLFIMILVSACTFTDYYVQVKQYTMELLLSLVAIWQLIELSKLQTGNLHRGRYLLLCTSFMVVPFFSYTYPIAIAPVFIIQFLVAVRLLRNAQLGRSKILLLQWLPILLCTISIGIFYVIDVSQLMADKGMHVYWGHLMMQGGFKWSAFFWNIYNLFAEIGAGMLFWYLFGIIGVLSYLYGLYTVAKNMQVRTNSTGDIVLLYSALLITLMILLFVAGKLPLGEPRLNGFSIPAIAILIIRLFDEMNTIGAKKKVANVLSIVFFVGVTGNIYTTFSASVTGDAYKKKMLIYNRTENAITLAEARKTPIFITPEVTWPYDHTANLPDTTTLPGDWVLKTFPAYHVANKIPVYPIERMKDAASVLKKISPGNDTVLVGDGITYKFISR